MDWNIPIIIMDENIVHFQSLLSRLGGIYMHEVGENITRKIAKRIHATSVDPSDWKDFAAEIGINNTLVLEEIEVSAAMQKMLPLHVAFSTLLQYHCKLHDVIQALINLERADILCLIREEFEAFLEERESRQLHNAYSTNHNDSATKEEFPEDNLTLTDESVSSENLFCGTETDTCKLVEASKSSGLVDSCSGKQKTEELVAKVENTDCSRTEDSSYEYLDSLQCNKKLRDIPVIKCSSNCPTQLKVAIPKPSKKTPEPISVFVPYAESTIAVGIKFANLLRRAGFKVITISEAEFLIRIDRSGFLKVLLERVDFVVPVISEEYITYVRPSGNLLKFNNDAKTNRFIFTWLHSEFENNYCFNVRVKPVIVEGFDKQLIEREPIFQWVHQLWDEVDRLAKILHETKQMMQDLMASWNQEEFVKQWMNYLNRD